MTIASELTNLQQDITNARTAINNKGGTVTANGGSSQLATDIATITELKGETRTVQLSNSNGNTFTPTTGKNGITSITVTPKNYARYVIPETRRQTLGIPSGYSGNGSITVAAVTSSIDSNIQAGNIKQGVKILNITGTYTGTQPTGTLTITENGTYDISTYASANVNVSGGGGVTGHNLEYRHYRNGGSYMYVTLNGQVTTFPLHAGSGYSTGEFSRIIIPNITSVTIDSQDYSYEGDCTVEFTTGGVTQSVPFGTTLNLTQDAILSIIEGDCLLKGTIITMADGSFKEISTLKLGDKVLSINPETLEQEEDEVTFCDGDTKKYNDNYDLWEFENGYEVRTTHHHRFYNVERQAMVYLDEWNIGEHTIDVKGNQIALLKHTNLIKEVHHFTLATKNWNIYFANGLVCGNRNSTELHLGTEEQRRVESQPSVEIGVFNAN